MKNIPLYPVISKALYHTMKPNLEFVYSYKNNGDYSELDVVQITKSIIKLEDTINEGEWDYIGNGFKMVGKLSLNKPYQYLRNRKIIVKETIVGISIVWYSSDSKQRGVIKVGELNEKSPNDFITFEFEKEFLPKQLLSKIEFELVFYIDRPGKPYPNEKHIANEKGVSIGTFYLHQIQFDGIGSLFPIYTMEDPNAPLWEISINIEDSPFNDQFNDSIKVSLNTAHRAYGYIDHKKDTFNKFFFAEVIASAMATIMMELSSGEENWISLLDSQEPEPGSIMHAIKYYIETLGWDYDSLESINKSIRLYLDKEL